MRDYSAVTTRFSSFIASVLFAMLLMASLAASNAGADYWETVETPNGGDLTHAPEITTYADGTASLLWVDHYNVKSQAVDVDGSLTGAPVILLQHFTSLAAIPVRPDRSIVVGYRGFSDEPYVLTARSFNLNGATGASYNVLEDIPESAIRLVSDLRMVANGDGTANVLWSERIGNDNFVRARRLGVDGPLSGVRTLFDSTQVEIEGMIGTVVSASSSLDGTAWVALQTISPFGYAKLAAVKLGADSAVVRDIEIADGAWHGPAAIAALPGGSAQIAWTIGGYWTGAIYTRSVEGKTEHRCYFGSEGWSYPGETCVASSGGSFSNPTPFQIALASDRRGVVSLVATDRGGRTRRWTVDGSDVSIPTLLAETSSQYNLGLQLQAGSSYSVALWHAFPNTPYGSLYASSSPESIEPGPTTHWEGGSSGAAHMSSAIVEDPNAQPAIKAAWTTYSGDLIVSSFHRTDDQAGSEPFAAGTVMNRAKTCPAVRVIGVRGSGEDPGLGKPVSSFVNELRRQVESTIDRNGRRSLFSYKALTYDAVAVVDGMNSLVGLQAWINQARQSGEYYDSVLGGKAALIEALNQEAWSPCVDYTKYVLAGYSQGAQVIGEVLEQFNIPNPIRDRLYGVALFGDPRFASTASGITARSTFHPAQTGALGKRAAGAFLPIPSRLRIYSFCRAKDFICQGTRDFPSGTGPHERYPQAETNWAAWLIANRAFRPSPRSTEPDVAMRLAGGQDERLEFSCVVAPRGVCQVNVDVEELRAGLLFPVVHRLRVVGSADATGLAKLSVDIPNAFTPALRLAVKGRAIGIGAGQVEADTSFAELLR